MYFKLSKVCENLGHEMMSVVEEHDEIAAHGREIRDCLMSVRAGAIVLQDTICNEITHYIDTLRDHMGLEETRLFPLARESLGPDDWAEIDSTMAARTDPLFGAESESRYERVRRFLEQEMSGADTTE